MARARNWSALGASTRARYERNGVDRAAYESGVSLKAARGHANTPERPGLGQDAPEYQRYYDIRKEITRLKTEIYGRPPGRSSNREMSTKGHAALVKARDYLRVQAANEWSWADLSQEYPELQRPEYDWIKHYH